MANMVYKPSFKLAFRVKNGSISGLHNFNIIYCVTSILDTIAKSLNFEPYEPKSGEKYMNENQRAHFLELLTSWKQELLGESSRTVVNLQDETINHPDQIDRASQETDMSIELRNRDRERRLIRKIDESIVRLETGGYGYCETCGIEIGLGRLEARPTATLCLDCKVLDEIKERRQH